MICIDFYLPGNRYLCRIVCRNNWFLISGQIKDELKFFYDATHGTSNSNKENCDLSYEAWANSLSMRFVFPRR